MYPNLHCRWNALTEIGAWNRRSPGWLMGSSHGNVKIGDWSTLRWVVTAPSAAWQKYLRPGVHETFGGISALAPIAADEPSSYPYCTASVDKQNGFTVEPRVSNRVPLKVKHPSERNHP